MRVEFKYEWDGATFHNNDLHPFTTGIGNLESLASRLNKAAKDGTEVTCYVNPRDAQEAFLLREFRWTPLLGTSFVSVVFFAVAILAVYALRNWHRK